jgi:hypothetical protein
MSGKGSPPLKSRTIRSRRRRSAAATLGDPVESTTFAEASDVAARLGRDLTEAEQTAAAFLCEAATAVIEEAVESTRSALGSGFPPVLKFLCVEKVIRALSNPSNLAQETETLGQYTHSQRFRGEGNELELSDLEERMARRAVRGTLSGSVAVRSHIDDVYDALIGS